ncbi:MAG: hypothetical protein J0G95_10935 [Rhizobiales bacterium]|nr:hypothetical protein [Hyphomicrobiales bacterium]
MEHDNENEPLTFKALSAATERVLWKLHDQKNQQNEHDRACERATDEKESERGRYVDQRLKELAALERRARG